MAVISKKEVDSLRKVALFGTSFVTRSMALALLKWSYDSSKKKINGKVIRESEKVKRSPNNSDPIVRFAHFGASSGALRNYFPSGPDYRKELNLGTSSGVLDP
ncbi:MAG: hypothetical protein QF682_07845 [Candidatus Thermoplasmatota archaeon]|jgi:hypothetical protein|nr:hypothetical protein [Candidatus Thermoplasmatota archaeon]